MVQMGTLFGCTKVALKAWCKACAIAVPAKNHKLLSPAERELFPLVF